MKKNYENDIVVDANKLDGEWIKQSSLFLHYAQEHTELSFVRDKAKFDLEQTKAELDKEIRTNPEEFGLAKITEAVVSNTILLHNRYKTKMEIYLDAGYEVDTLTNVLRAFEHKKKTLEYLVQLHLSGYNSEPSETKVREEVELGEARKRSKKKERGK